MNKKFFITACILFCLSSLIFGQSALVNKYLTAANTEYTVRNNEKAYTYINIVLEQYEEDTVPDNALLLAEAIYFDYLSDVKKTENVEAFQDIQRNLINYEYLASNRLKKQLDSVTNFFLEKSKAEEAALAQKNAEKAAIAAAKASAEVTASAAAEATAKATTEAISAANDEIIKRFENFSQEQLKQNQELQTSQREMLGNMLSEIQDSNQESSKKTTSLIVILLCIAGFLVLIVSVVVVVTIKMGKRQQELFTETLRVVSEMQRIPLEAADSLRLADVYSGMRAIEDAGRPRQKVNTDFEEKEVDDKLRAELRELATACEKEGLKIDKATKRKNNSKNVAEMVFKIAQHMGLGEYKSMLYFCASMVYDIGFLRIDPNLMEAESLTEEQKYQIRSHVRAGSAMLDFVPEKFRPVFLEATLMHHENLDGSGYPDGLVGQQIPPIAKMIRLVESFIAQISKRNYRGIFDKETALEELRKHPEWYDQEIVDVLDKLI